MEEEFYDRLTLLEVEENADLPGAVQMRLPVAAREDGDLTSVNDAGLQPLKNIAVTVTVDEGLPACIFDGYVLSHKLVAKSGMRASSLEVYGQDAAWLMNLEEKTREWANVTEGMAANTIFSEYGFLPDPSNMEDDSGPYTPEGHTLMQRGTDWEFLKMLARRSGRLCRVAGGMTPGMNIGIFAAPKLDAEPVATLKLNDPAAPNTAELTFEWDVMRPTAVKARQALLAGGGAEGAAGDAAGSGLTPLDERDLATFAGMPMTAMLTTAADDTGQVGRRAAALLRDAGWFVKCTGEVDAGALRAVLRVGDLVDVEGVGSVNSGRYLVWSVRHVIDAQSHRMRLALVRNAVGPEAPESSGMLGGLI